ncbi:MAG TPA: CHAD domain-containing protein [Candidatus Cybelea sp.]|nr:CHAD domain-containing protein [Candidatus Cybelea sp.]
MKAQRVDLRGVGDLRGLAERVVRVRLREARTLARALDRRDCQSLHDFRIACKRLRYALERFQGLDASLETIAGRLAAVQERLGEAHDRDVLLAILPAAMSATERRLQAEREASIDRARAHWQECEQLMQALDSHRI